MRTVVLFLAMSLDGYIADRNGGVDWLSGQSEQEESIDTYAAFVKDIDTVIMGWNTYHQVVTELSPGEWIYSDLTSYVVTHRELPSTEQIIFTKEDPCALVKKLKQEPGKDIWICGGSKVIQQLMEEDLIDRYYISVIPTILGDGIRLFGTMEKEIKLQLIKTQTYNGITDLVYQHRL
ncbi:MAG: dihydrofolate reductase family protein [Lachnospiraceae bacterium]|nr:dihydrofolate reductase family protein [Lachnospiraceae bacterium]